MKLTIDTKEDSKEEIRKAIRMLATIVGDENVYTNSPLKEHNPNVFESSSSEVAPSSPEPGQGSVFGNIFGDMGQSSSSGEPEKEEKKEKPQIIVEY